MYLPGPFPRGLEVVVELSSRFLTLTLLMHIDRLGLVNYLYRCLFNCITACQGSWAGAAAFHMEIGWCYTIAASAWCSTNQLFGCECTVKRSHALLEHLNASYIGIYSYMQLCINAFECMCKLQTCIYIIMHLFTYLFMLLYSCICVYICISRCILACIWSCPTSSYPDEHIGSPNKRLLKLFKDHKHI